MSKKVQRLTEPDREPRRVGELVGQVVHACVNVREPALDMGAVVMMVGTVIHRVNNPTGRSSPRKRGSRATKRSLRTSGPGFPLSRE